MATDTEKLNRELKEIQRSLGEIQKAVKSNHRKPKTRPQANTEFEQRFNEFEDRVTSFLIVNAFPLHLLIPSTLCLFLAGAHAINQGAKIDWVRAITQGDFAALNPFKKPSNSSGFEALLQSIDRSSYKVGEIAGSGSRAFPVTSVFGLRPAPTPGASTYHRGVDLGMPIGVPFLMPLNGVVECIHQEVGAGIGAIVNLTQFPDYEFRLYHLSSCTPGTFQKGQQFAKSGNTGGTSTGAHLHFEQFYKRRNIHINPMKGLVDAFLVGFKTEPLDSRLFTAIIQKESGGDPNAVNPHSGALGLGQVMPENVPSWSKECLGRSVSQSEFLSNPGLQKQIISCKLNQYWKTHKKQGENDFEACRSVAATWYSGQPSLKNSTRPQSFNGGKYPSIDSYTRSVCKVFQK